MFIKNLYRRSINQICVGGFYLFYGFICFVPKTFFRWTGRLILRLFIRVIIPKRRLLGNLSAAFGESYANATKDGFARGVQDHFVENLLDCFIQLADNQHAQRIITIEGIEHLESALEMGKGVIALGAHIGNFVLLGSRLGLAGYKFHTLFRVPRDRAIENVVARYLPRYHYAVIPSQPRRVAARKILDALRKNEIVYILGDNLKRGRIDALLFSQKVPAPRGPISLALRSGAPLVPMYLVRTYHGNMALVIEPAMEMIRTRDLTGDIKQNTQRLVLYLESLIRRYPDQWNWLTVRLVKFQKNNLLQPIHCVQPNNGELQDVVDCLDKL